MCFDAYGHTAGEPLSGVLWQKGTKAGREGAKCRRNGVVNRRYENYIYFNRIYGQ